MVGVEGTWGTPLARSGWWGVPGVPQPDVDGGGREYLGYPLGQVWMVGGTWGTPQPGVDGGGREYLGYPPARSGWWGVPGVSPNQVWMVGVGSTWSIPPGQFWMVGKGYLGYPSPGLVWMGGPIPKTGWGVTPSQVWMVGVPGVPPGQV